MRQKKLRVRGGHPLTLQECKTKYGATDAEIAEAIGIAGAVFSSGAKSSEEQPRIDLIPWEAIRREAVRMGEGAAAHGENNYRGGKHDAAFVCDRVNHLLRHAILYANGDRSDDHLAAIRANAGMLIWIEENQ